MSVPLLFASACGGGGSGNGGGSTPPPQSPTITSVIVTCPSLTVPTGQTSQCSAAVNGTGSYDSSLTWSVNGTAGGASSIGTISAAGLYTAPNSVPTPYTVSVKATSVVDTAKSASFSLIVAGTIATVTQPIGSASGGTITLPDGSSVTIAPNTLASDQSITLSEVSYLSQQPPDESIKGVGPGLVLTFSTPFQLNPSTRNRTRNLLKNASISAS